MKSLVHFKQREVAFQYRGSLTRFGTSTSAIPTTKPSASTWNSLVTTNRMWTSSKASNELRFLFGLRNQKEAIQQPMAVNRSTRVQAPTFPDHVINVEIKVVQFILRIDSGPKGVECCSVVVTILRNLFDQLNRHAQVDFRKNSPNQIPKFRIPKIHQVFLVDHVRYRKNRGLGLQDVLARCASRICRHLLAGMRTKFFGNHHLG